MEEDATVKAPVTRLRRRLSVEQSEEAKSPALNTPTKKRTRRAKPELELIDENTPEITTKTRKKTVEKDTKDIIEEKPVTPSRRSIRIKSNTSIVSETALTVNSPRAKRAARRNSVIGSDSEAPPTPVRQTRRTRKDSTSSLEKVEVPPASKPTAQITEVIVEEPENNDRKSIHKSEKDDSISPNSIRKSPRLVEKKTKNSPKPVKENEIVFVSEQSAVTPSRKSIDESHEQNQYSDSQKELQENKVKNRLSLSSANLINDVVINVSKIKTHNLNKTISGSSDDNKKVESNRKRTKSWTIFTSPNESNNFYRDNESNMKKNTSKVKEYEKFNESGSGDALVKTSILDNSNNSEKSFSKKRKNNSGNFIVEDIDNSVNKSKNKSGIVNNEGNTSAHVISSEKQSNLIESFNKKPSGDVQVMVSIDIDSDSNQSKNIKHNTDSEDQCVPVVNHPVHIENEENKAQNNMSCEPMDVDETVPESLLVDLQNSQTNLSKRNSISHIEEVNKSVKTENLSKSKRKSSFTSNLEKSSNDNKSTLILSELKDLSSNELSNAVKSPNKKNFTLSKSTEELNITQENDINKRNISLNYVTTSTPLQQKNLKKLALNVNTSLISLNDSKNVIDSVHLSKSQTTNDRHEVSSNENRSSKESNEANESNSKSENSNNDISNNSQLLKNTSKNKSLNTSKKNISQNNNTNAELNSDDESLNIKRKKKPSKLSNSNTSSESESDNENESTDVSQDSNKLLDDKASDAGDDYESGDSQNEDEKDYIKQNEILVKGETLTSEDDFSNDSDYEKDSFVVSSIEEDNELLDGTENDLSMSDNELNMTAKSKKKYNERKRKEGKKASKEMYEARHELSLKSKSGKVKKQQMSSSESEEEYKPKSRKNRMRFDSANETSMIKDDIEPKSKKDDSIVTGESEKSVINEEEITFANKSTKETDPLSNSQIKQELKSPDTESASITFIHSDDINDVDTNELTKTQIEIDPQDAEEDDNSLSSDTEIMQNYDSILEGLNKSNKGKPKTCDISLNLSKKVKKQKATLVDELNLTQVKSIKNNKKKAKETVKSKLENLDDATSDSIDLNLLFSEDSSNSDSVQDWKNDTELIPLKRKEGKMDIRERKNEPEENNLSFFIDTEGSHKDSDQPNNTSLNDNKKTSIENDSDSDSNEAPLEISFQKSFNENKSINESISKTPPSDKKKKKSKNLQAEEMGFNENKSNNQSVSKTPPSAKKKKESKNLQTEEMDEAVERSFNVSLSGKKERKPLTGLQKEDIVTTLDMEQNDGEKHINTSSSSKKKKKSISKIQESEHNEIEKNEENMNNSLISKMKNKFLIEEKQNETSKDSYKDEENMSLTKTYSKQKKNKNILESQNKSKGEDEITRDQTVNKTPNKNKKTLYVPDDEKEPVNDESLNASATKTPTSRRKKKNRQIEESLPDKLDVSLIESPGSHKKYTEAEDTAQVEAPVTNKVSSKKRKRQESLNVTVEEINEKVEERDASDNWNESLNGSKKKKIKISLQSIQNIVDEKQEESLQSLGDKKNKKMKNPDTVSTQKESSVTDTLKPYGNKRKQREDDDEVLVSKVSKQSSFDKQVPRLPANILRQLDEKPKQEFQVQKKAKAISTTQFLVVESRKRKNKPSNYLEDSVYLNDDDSENKKHKKRLFKPKVLPFVPTAITSGSGYTTNFKVNVIPSEIKFVAQTSNIPNFKENYIFEKKIKRQGTYELYKKNRNVKISKF